MFNQKLFDLNVHICYYINYSIQLSYFKCKVICLSDQLTFSTSIFTHCDSVYAGFVVDAGFP